MPEPSHHVYLGLDFGLRRVGVATGQTQSSSATALCTLTYGGNLNQLWPQLTPLVNEWQPDAFVLGLPYNMDDRPHEFSPQVKAFGQKLHQRYHKPIHYMDERLSSIEAEQILQESGKKLKRGSPAYKEAIDRIAAKLILESWLWQQQQTDSS